MKSAIETLEKEVKETPSELKADNPFARLSPRDFSMKEVKTEKPEEGKSMGADKAAEPTAKDFKEVNKEVVEREGVTMEKTTTHDLLDGSVKSSESLIPPSDWQSELTAELLQKDNTLTRFKTVDDLAESYLHLYSKMQESGKIKPDASFDELVEAGAKMFDVSHGNKYIEHDALKELSDEERVAVAELGVRHGVHPEILKSIHGEYVNMAREAVLQSQHEMFDLRKDYDKELAATWGEDLRDVQKHVVEGCAAAGIDYNKLTDLEKRFPPLIKMAVEFSKFKSASSSITGTAPAVTSQVPQVRKSPEELEMRLQEILRDPAYLDRGHVSHRVVRQEYDNLMKLKYPDER